MPTPIADQVRRFIESKRYTWDDPNVFYPVRLRWPRCKQGYEWQVVGKFVGKEDGGHTWGEEPVITPRNGPDGEPKFESYDPMVVSTALLDDFAAIPTHPGELTQDRMLEFANQYGLLWEPDKHATFESWNLEVVKIQLSLDALDLYRAKSSSDVDSREVVDAAQTLQNFPSYGLHEHTSCVFTKTQGRRHFETKICPKTLLGAVWLQFAAAVEADRSTRRCASPECGRLFFVYDARRIYCSDRCKFRTMYLRKKGRIAK